MQKRTHRNPLYLLVCALIRLFFRRPDFVGAEKLPDEPCVIVGNHTQMNGPIIAELSDRKSTRLNSSHVT